MKRGKEIEVGKTVRNMKEQRDSDKKNGQKEKKKKKKRDHDEEVNDDKVCVSLQMIFIIIIIIDYNCIPGCCATIKKPILLCPSLYFFY